MITPEVASLIASFVSVGIAILAIWLSIVFYRMSTELAKSTQEAAKVISSSVERLENLFDHLYSDTFSMMKDTVSDMRKHIWPDTENKSTDISDIVEKRAQEKIDEVKKEIGKDISQLLKKQHVTDVNISKISQELERVVDRVIKESRQAEIEAREETTRQRILATIRRLRRIKRTVRAEDIVDDLSEKTGILVPAVLDELHRMKAEKVLEWTEVEGVPLAPDVEIRLVHSGSR